MDKNIVNQIESKFKSMSIFKLMMLAFVLGGGGTLVFVITRDILNMFN